MIPVTVEQLADAVGGDLLGTGAADALVDSVVIDSRQVRPGAVFVALPGEHTDGHAFVADAHARGATAALVRSDRADALPGGVSAVLVDDPADALLGLGKWVRDVVDPLVVGITGSSGKTTTKDLVAAAVAAGRAAVATRGSYNNELGLPLTCCELALGDDLLVAEVGARGIGHIAALAAVLRPDIAVLTTIGGAHLEMFGSVEAVARAKGELVEALSPAGVAILNADDARVAALAERAPGRVVTYGRSESADWRADDVTLDAFARPRFTVRGVPVALPLPGEHNIGNALAALAVAAEAEVDLESAVAALERARVSHWRMELVRTRRDVTVLNDAYNANPSSMSAALKTLVRIDTPGRRWAVLGQMAELGVASTEEHDRIGRLAIRLGVDGLVVVGEAARAIRNAADLEGFYGQGDLFAVDDAEGALAVLRGRVGPGDVVLVKASRAAGLERVADGLVAALGGAAQGGAA